MKHQILEFIIYCVQRLHGEYETCNLGVYQVQRGKKWLDASNSQHAKFVNTLRPRQNGRHLPDDIFKCISLNENVRISIEISLKSVRKGAIDNIPALVQIMNGLMPTRRQAIIWTMMVRLPTHICVTRPQ